MKYEIERKIRNLPNDKNLYSKINPDIWVETIRDAMTGKSQHHVETEETNPTFRTFSISSSSSDAIGIQYLMSTTTVLHDGISFEQRNAMIQRIHQTQWYYTNTVLPTQNDTAIALCWNQSPYCTYWAVVFDRCHDSFYHSVMSKHCPVTCQRCLEETTNTTTNDQPKYRHQAKATASTKVVHMDINERMASTSTTTNSTPKAVVHDVYNSRDDISTTQRTTVGITIGDASHLNDVEATTTSQSVPQNESLYVFDSETCVFDPNLMPDVWFPNSNNSVNQMFERIIAKDLGNDRNIHSHQNSTHIGITILSRPVLEESILLTRNEKDDASNNQHNNENQQPPWLIQIDHFLSDAECDHLIHLGNTLGYERSTGIDLQQHQVPTEKDTVSTSPPHQLHNVISDERTSSTTWCHPTGCSEKDDIIQSLYHRIQDMIQIPSSHYESLQLLQYQVGQYYKVR
jgi:hypothetical protein